MSAPPLTRPFFYVDEGKGLPFCFIGGAPPNGIAPDDESLRFIATVPTADGASRMSIFVPESVELSQRGDGRWRQGGVSAKVHEPLVRGAHGPFASALSAHGLSLGPAIADEAEDGGLLGGLKLGGRPRFLRYSCNVEEDSNAIWESGCQDLIQFEPPQPGPEATKFPTGPWPFGEGTFLILYRLRPTFQFHWLFQP
jgi:hypothetical protein